LFTVPSLPSGSRHGQAIYFLIDGGRRRCGAARAKSVAPGGVYLENLIASALVAR